MFFKRKEKPEHKEELIKCNHIFDSYRRIYDCKRMCQIFYLKCELCNEITSINVSDRFLYDLQDDIYNNGINMR